MPMRMAWVELISPVASNSQANSRRIMFNTIILALTVNIAEWCDPVCHMAGLVSTTEPQSRLEAPRSVCGRPSQAGQ